MSAPGFVDAGRCDVLRPRRAGLPARPISSPGDRPPHAGTSRLCSRGSRNCIVDLGCSRGRRWLLSRALPAGRVRWASISAGPMLADRTPASAAGDAGCLVSRICAAAFWRRRRRATGLWRGPPVPGWSTCFSTGSTILCPLAEAHRVLETGGLLMFSTLGPTPCKGIARSFADTTPRPADHRHARPGRPAGRLRLCRSGHGHGDRHPDLRLAGRLLGELRAAGSIAP